MFYIFLNFLLLLQYGISLVPVIGILYDKKAFNPVPNAALHKWRQYSMLPQKCFLRQLSYIYITLTKFKLTGFARYIIHVDDENRRSEECQWMGNKFLLHFFDLKADNKKYVIWTLTSGILMTAASVVYQRPPAFGSAKT